MRLAPRSFASLCVIGCAGAALLACSKDGSKAGSHASGAAGQDAFGNTMTNAPTSSSAHDAGPSHTAPSPPSPASVPTTGFTDTEVGGYKLGPAVKPGELDAGIENQPVASGCSVMVGIVRDFRGSNEPDGHPDFESFEGKKPTTGLLADDLGADSKPIYASRCEAMPDRMLCPYGQMTTSKEAFDQWYRSTPGVNDPYIVYLKFAKNGDVYTFQSDSFFPLDPVNPGGTGTGKKNNHDFGFTTELHVEFLYQGGEQFTFTGDDNLWVFVNGKLAIDLGGLHPPASGKLDLDADATKLGLEIGHTYPLDLFHAERHTNASNFRVDTTLGFTACGEITPDLI